MKKTIFAALLACLLLLSGCRKAPAEGETPAPTPTQGQTAETPPVSPDPEASNMPDNENAVFPQFLKDFTFLWADTLVPEGGMLQFITYQLTAQDRDTLKSSIDMDSWWEADDVPAMGLEGDDTLYDSEGHSLIFAPWDEEKCLILAKEDSQSYLYHAPLSVLEAFENFMADKPFLPDFIRYFTFDQIEIDRTPYEDREGYKDFDVYLLDDAQLLSFFRALEPESWTVAREDLPAVMYYDALRARDPLGNEIILAPWDEEKCLVNCFFADGWSTARYWAPASVLDDALALVDGLTPLGTIDNEAARYYDLFWADPGFDALLALAEENGRISADQIAAYALVCLAYDGPFDSEVGVSPSSIDRLSQKHFGRILDSYNTSMSKTLPSGNVTPTGWDIGGSRCLVLNGTPEEDEYGNISATFLVYILGEDAWMDGTMAPELLSHMREYVLTGNTGEYPDPIKVSVTFRIETDRKYGVWREYPVYDAVRVMD